MIIFESVTKRYLRNGQTFEALSNVSFNLRPNRISGIIGKSGAGKSSILRLINGLDRPDSGRVIVNNTPITEQSDIPKFRSNIGYVFQHLNLIKNISVHNNIALPFQFAHTAQKDVSNRVKALLELVDLDGYQDRYPNELSGGQKQRVAIARAIATKPDILLFDEATSALDPETTQMVIELLIRLQKELSLTIVFVSHEINFVKKLADDILLIDNGKIIEQRDKLDFFVKPQSNIAKEYVFQDLNKHISFAISPEIKNSSDTVLLRLSFNNENAHEPLMANLCVEHKIIYNIVAGEVEQISDRQVGQLLITIASKDEETSFNYFNQNNIDCEKLGYVENTIATLN